MKVPVLAVVGHANSGKTTLLEKLIPYLVRAGLRIASIKHTHHDVSVDQPGTDSWRHKHSGSAASFLATSGQLMMVADLEEEADPVKMVEGICNGYDLILVEGLSSFSGAKIEVLRSRTFQALRCRPSELLALVSDIPDFYPGLDQFGPDDIESLGHMIMSWLRREASMSGQGCLDCHAQLRESN
jgi:molybdopterin-guanine dinucleotide biosynthesis protein MobB